MNVKGARGGPGVAVKEDIRSVLLKFHSDILSLYILSFSKRHIVFLR